MFFKKIYIRTKYTSMKNITKNQLQELYIFKQIIKIKTKR